MIAELPAYVDDATIPLALRAAAVDAFFIHLRLLIEFLIKGDHHSIRRQDYLKDFHLDQALRARLNADYDFASRHVAHFNAERVPAADSHIFEPVDCARLSGHERLYPAAVGHRERVRRGFRRMAELATARRGPA